MARNKPSSDDRTVEREDEIRHPQREGDIDEIGAVGGDADQELDEQEDEEFDDEDQTEDEEIEDEDVG
jgi:hypothetical protein